LTTYISDDPEMSNGLNYVGLAVLSNEECRMVYGNQLTDDMVCVEGNFNEGACLVSLANVKCEISVHFVSCRVTVAVLWWYA
jgi:hypothetical protein